MVFSFAMDATGACLCLGQCAIPPNSCDGASFRKNWLCGAAIFGSSAGVLEPFKLQGLCYRGTGAADKIPRDSSFSQTSPGDSSMVITAAHIQPIVALIAGILILIMPRFLNLVVAIYLIFIGLAGLGLFKMLKM
jgi:hypothetical protein